ncbi:hypothetical protein J2S11_004266 [Bacillus horti]|uniref:S-layer homology domain-containing protein n=1 Tax=Caldalkalibacillus horti TaxID=77523 RepID=A0ABT9W5G4_9BACI|nr:hypothetical protein [Bacillus horti]
MEEKGHVLSGILNGSTTLIEGSDYLRVGNTVTINKEYLTTLPIGQVVLTFDFGVDTQLPLTIDISNSTPIPGAPYLQPAIASDEQVSLTWIPVDDATSYKIYQSLSPTMNGTEVGTVVGSVYDYTATGLVNGTTYYFTVRGENVQGESPASNIVSATPFTIPGAPTNVVAVPSNRQATITFDAPAFDGGSPITDYEVTVYPEGHSIIRASSPIVVMGLTNGEAYTFTVKANNAAGSSVESAASDSITPSAPPSGGGSTPLPPIDPEPQPLRGVDVRIDGKLAAAGTVSVSQSKREGRTVLVVALNQDNLAKQVASMELGGVLEVHASRQVDEVYVELSRTQLEFLREKQVLLELQAIKGTYRLPIEAIDIQRALADTEKPVTLQEFKVRIGVGEPREAVLNLAESVAETNGFTLLSDPVDFTVEAYHGDTQLEVLPFDRYVERLIQLPESRTPPQMTTAIVLEKGGTVRHVPTKVESEDGQEYAVASSLTNSTYALISHSLTFEDVQAQWAKEAVNDLGARLIVQGDSRGLFYPREDITRAEFAEILINSLGLKLNSVQVSPYPDVMSSAWYNDVIQTAYEYNLINGFEDGTFRPADKLTREQAMKIFSSAMKLTGLKDKLSAQIEEELLTPFSDANEAGQWALSGIADSLQAGIVTGRDRKTLAPKAFITRAEVAVMVQRLLRESGLIN